MHSGQKQHEFLNAENIKLKSNKLVTKKESPQKNEELIFRTDAFNQQKQPQSNVINFQIQDFNTSEPLSNSRNSLNKSSKRYSSKNSTPVLSDLAQPLLQECNEQLKKTPSVKSDFAVNLNQLSPTVSENKKKQNEKLKSSSESTITFNENSYRADQSDINKKPKPNLNPNNNNNNNSDSNGFNLKLPFINNRLFNSTKVSAAPGLSTTPKSTLQAQIYNFLERPTGWKCFIYHFTV